MKAGVVAVVGGAQHPADDVLSGVLLHVVKAPGPVDFPVDELTHGQCPVTGVENHAVLLLHIQNHRAAQGAVVGGLTAALGVEGGLIQLNQPFFPLGTAIDHHPVKFPQKCIFII